MTTSAKINRFILLLSVACTGCGESSSADASDSFGTDGASTGYSDTGSSGEGSSSGGAEECEDWDYERGMCGPAYWGELYPECGIGMGQSPIELETPDNLENPPLPVSDLDLSGWSDTEVNIVNNGHTIQYDVGSGSVVNYGGTEYQLVQFHFHSLSEHTVDDDHHTMEMHLVHQSADGEYLVIGAFIDEHDEPGYQEDIFDEMMWSEMPEEAEGEYVSAEVFALGNGLRTLIQGAAEDDEEAVTGWTYEGSFTTPPCTEGVVWIVYEHPILLTSDYISAFTDLYDHNYRPLQDLNDRDVEWSIR